MLKAASIMGVMASTLSVVLLIKHGFEIGFVAPLRIMLDFYNQWADFLFGWADPFVKSKLLELRSLLGINLHLYPHWKHVFIPMWLYFGANVRGEIKKGRKYLAVANVIWGFLLALISSVAAGTVDLHDPNLFYLIFPMTGLIFHDVVISFAIAIFYGYAKQHWRETLAYYLSRTALLDSLIVAVILIVALDSPQSQEGNVLLLIAFFLAVAGRQILISAWAASSDRQGFATWIERFQSLAGQKVGFLVVQVIAGSGLFIAVNAGLKLAGL